MAFRFQKFPGNSDLTGEPHRVRCLLVALRQRKG